MSELAKVRRPSTLSKAVSWPENAVADPVEVDSAADVAVKVPETNLLAGAPPTSLEAATRLVDPMRLNNLTPEDITPRHLRRAMHEVRKARRNLEDIQLTSMKLLLSARGEAQIGQQLARMSPGRRRAKQVQQAVHRMQDLRSMHAALQEERARFARKIAAAHDLANAWDEAFVLKRAKGKRVRQGLRHLALNSAREDRLASERLNDLERALRHTAVAEDAMRRDTDALRLDPVNFARFAGRTRKRVQISIAVVLAAMFALVFPPWSPPHIALGCSVPSQAQACDQVSPTSSVRITNTGLGTLLGWITITSQRNYSTSTHVMPLVVLPHTTRSLSCGDLGSCTFDMGNIERVEITSTGGSYSLTIAP